MTLEQDVVEVESEFEQIALAVSQQMGVVPEAHDLFWRMYDDYCAIKIKYRDSIKLLSKEYMFHINNYTLDKH